LPLFERMRVVESLGLSAAPSLRTSCANAVVNGIYFLSPLRSIISLPKYKTLG
jgi:hypothetical protein